MNEYTSSLGKPLLAKGALKKQKNSTSSRRRPGPSSLRKKGAVADELTALTKSMVDWFPGI